MGRRFLNDFQLAKMTESTVVRLLKARGWLQRELFACARKTRKKYFNEHILVRGVIEVSNYCQCNCDYCAVRCQNRKLKRYRLTAAEIFSVAKKIKSAGIRHIMIQAGEDSAVDQAIEEALPRIKKELKISEIILCLGRRSRRQYEKFKKQGASAYIIKFETSNSGLFRKLKHQSLAERLKCLTWLKAAGFRVGTGNIVGLPGQTIKSLAKDILLARTMKTDFVSSAPFIANENSPLSGEVYGDFDLTLNAVAILRVVLKKVFIPSVSALETIKRGGQLGGLNAGANVVTINFTPKRHRGKYQIYSSKRFVVSLKHVRRIILLAKLKSDIKLHN